MDGPSTPLLATYLDRRNDLKRFFLLRTRSEPEAEDLLQDLYIKVAGVSADEEVRNPAAFLYRLGGNLMLDRMRQQRRSGARDAAYRTATTETAGAEDVADLPSAETIVASKQQLAILLQRLASLPERTQQVFRMHRFDGLGHIEIASRLGMSRRAVEKRMSSALRHLATGKKP